MTVIMAAIMLLMTATPAFAANDTELYISDKLTLSLYSKETVKNAYFSNTSYIAYLGKGKVSVKSSNPKVATAKAKSQMLEVVAKKPGKTTITVKKGSKSYRCKLTVAKYASPVSSIKIGKTTISGKKFNKNAYIYQKYSKYASKKVAINVKAKKGWKLLELSYGQRNWKKAKNIKNGSTVRVKGGAGFGVLACMQNTATQQIEFVIVLYK